MSRVGSTSKSGTSPTKERGNVARSAEQKKAKENDLPEIQIPGLFSRFPFTQMQEILDAHPNCFERLAAWSRRCGHDGNFDQGLGRQLPWGAKHFFAGQARPFHQRGH